MSHRFSLLMRSAVGVVAVASCAGNEISSGLGPSGGTTFWSVGSGGSWGAGGAPSGGTSAGGTFAGGTSSGGSAAGGELAGGQASGGFSSGGAPGTGGTECVIPETDARRHPGVYDYESCFACHADWIGGWVYSNAMGDAWVEGATVTITNSDSTTVSVPTAEDGFFHLEGAITSTFTPCVSRCSDLNCAPAPHTSTDCQNSVCHGSTGHLIYLSLGSDAVGTGGSGSSDCTAPASGGPRMHYPDYDGQSCSLCHDDSYIGGYVYDGVASDTPVNMATLTLTAASGATTVAISGPGGMFQVGEGFTAPYTACVSKCPDTVCSAPSTHTTTDDCFVCHGASLRIHLP